VEAMGQPGDILVGISTSGNSPNIINAVELSKNIGIKTVGLLGKDGGKLINLCDESLVVPSNVTARIQEIHVMIYHFWCEIIDEAITK